MVFSLNIKSAFDTAEHVLSLRFVDALHLAVAFLNGCRHLTNDPKQWLTLIITWTYLIQSWATQLSL